jgi:hypothetical protein
MNKYFAEQVDEILSASLSDTLHSNQAECVRNYDQHWPDLLHVDGPPDAAQQGRSARFRHRQEQLPLQSSNWNDGFRVVLEQHGHFHQPRQSGMPGSLARGSSHIRSIHLSAMMCAQTAARVLDMIARMDQRTLLRNCLYSGLPGRATFMCIDCQTHRKIVCLETTLVNARY